MPAVHRSIVFVVATAVLGSLISAAAGAMVSLEGVGGGGGDPRVGGLPGSSVSDCAALQAEFGGAATDEWMRLFGC